jgi:hypothetical protein
MKRDLTTYSITKEEAQNGNIELQEKNKMDQTLIENTYGETAFTSTQTHHQFNPIKTDLIIIKSQLEDDGSITATKEINGEVKETTKLYGSQYSIKHDNYTVSKWPNKTVSETYYNHVSYSVNPELKTILYKEDRKLQFFNPVITDMITLGTHHRFEIEYNTIETRISIIHHYENQELLYNSVFD